MFQVGCKMACKFCATGTMGFKNNLSSGEIVEQLVHASRFSDIRNVVFMVQLCAWSFMLLAAFIYSILLILQQKCRHENYLIFCTALF